MPYLTAERKANLDNDGAPYSAGELTYLLYRATLDWSGDENSEQDFWTILGHRIQRFLGTEPPRYQDYAEVLGALLSTAWEFERRHPNELGGVDIDARHKAHVVMKFAHSYYERAVAPYEDTKIEQNGDVT